jgi:hypothetical protein
MTLLVRIVTTAFLVGSASLCSCTPDLGRDVPITDLWTKADLNREYAATTGVLRISGGLMGSTSCKGSSCTLYLDVPDPAWKPASGATTSIRIEVMTGTGENEMAPLPDKYSTSDLKVKGMGGKIFSNGDKVKVSGKFKCEASSMPCSIYAERFDAP